MRSTLIAAIATLMTSQLLLASMSEEVQLGWQFIREGQYLKAERVFEEILYRNPEDKNAWKGYQMAYRKRTAYERGEIQGGPGLGMHEQSSPQHGAPPLGGPPGSGGYSLTHPGSGPSGPDSGPGPRAPYPSGPEASGPAPSGPPPGGRPQAQSLPADTGPRQGPAIRIDPSRLGDHEAAKKRFEKLRDEMTVNYRRQRNGATEVVVTHYSPLTYKLLIERLSAEKGYTPEKAQQLLESSLGEMGNEFEFYIKLRNYTNGKVQVPIADIARRTYLLDSNNNLYEPIRFKGPKETNLVGEDAYTVWFPGKDLAGKTLLSDPDKKLVLVIRGLPYEPEELEMSFEIRRLQKAHGYGVDEKGMFQKMLDWFN